MREGDRVKAKGTLPGISLPKEAVGTVRVAETSAGRWVAVEFVIKQVLIVECDKLSMASTRDEARDGIRIQKLLTEQAK